LLAISFACFLLLFSFEGNWNSWKQATCLETGGCFCEKARDRLVRQPVNTFSNLVFCLVGVVVLMESIQQQIAKRSASDSERLGVAFSCLYAISQIVLGAGSGWFHASLTFGGQWIDNAAMYFTVTAPLLFTLMQLRVHYNHSIPNVAERYVAQWICSNVFLGWMVLVMPATRRWVFVVLILALLLVEMFARRVLPRRSQVAKLSLLGSAIISFAVAFFVWTLDIRRILCWPESIFQGHAVWHFLTGLSAFYIYLYYHPLANNLTLPSRQSKNQSKITRNQF